MQGYFVVSKDPSNCAPLGQLLGSVYTLPNVMWVADIAIELIQIHIPHCTDETHRDELAIYIIGVKRFRSVLNRVQPYCGSSESTKRFSSDARSSSYSICSTNSA